MPIDVSKIMAVFNRLGEPGFPPPSCPVLVDECCEEVYKALTLLDSLNDRKPVNPIPFESMPKDGLETIRKYVLDTLSGKQLKGKTAEKKYRNGIIVATIKRASEAHNHRGH